MAVVDGTRSRWSIVQRRLPFTQNLPASVKRRASRHCPERWLGEFERSDRWLPLRFNLVDTAPERHRRWLEPLYRFRGFWPYWLYFDLTAPPLY
jgi:hypothetical protein